MSSNFDPTTIVDFNGTLTNAQGSDAAGVVLALQNGTNGINNGADLQFGASTVGNTSIVISLAIQATATGFQSDQLQYTTDGINYANFGGTFTPISSSPGFGTPPAASDLRPELGLRPEQQRERGIPDRLQWRRVHVLERQQPARQPPDQRHRDHLGRRRTRVLDVGRHGADGRRRGGPAPRRSP